MTPHYAPGSFFTASYTKLRQTAAMKNRTYFLLAVVVCLTVLLTFHFYSAKNIVNLSITGLRVTAKAAFAANERLLPGNPLEKPGIVVLTYSYKGKQNPKTWAGKPITIYTKSLGTIHTHVQSASSTTLITAPNAYAGKATYAANAKDHARIKLKH